MTRRTPTVRWAAAAAVTGLLLAGCGGGSGPDQSSGGDSGVTVTNCGAEEAFPSPAERIYVNDGNMTSMLLHLGAEDQIEMVVGLERHTEVLSTVYGQGVVDALPTVDKDSISLEHVIAQKPDVVVAGWNYGYTEENNLTPDGLREHDIAPYVLSESCRQEDGARGTMPPWEALYSDMENLGENTGREEAADEAVTDIKDRLAELEEAPQAKEAPTVFVFDSASKDVLTSGSFGGPQAVIEAAGAESGTADVEDTWTRVSWERLVSSEPDVFAFVDYPGQTYEEKVRALRTNPGTKDLEAVEEERFVNLPYAAWTSGPLNIDAAEQLRTALEEYELVPESGIEPEHDLRPQGTTE